VFGVAGQPEVTEHGTHQFSGRSYSGDVHVGARVSKIVRFELDGNMQHRYFDVVDVDLVVKAILLFNQPSHIADEGYGAVLDLEGQWPDLDWGTGRLCLASG
jgi:hypothetical protein